MPYTRRKERENMELGGLVPALVTPFDREGRVNWTELRRLVKMLLEEGADGFYVTGSTGECFLLTDEERIRIASVVAETTEGKVPVIAHVGKIGAAQAAHLAKEVEKAGVSAVSSVPPFYYDFKFEEIVDYYKAISDAVELPLVIYNFPQFSGVTINAENLRRITDCCRVGGLKYTDSNLYELERIRRGFPDLKIMYGQDEAFLYALPIGVDGAIGSTYNFMLKKYKRILKAYQDGNMKLAEEIQHEACSIIDALLKIRDITAEKYLLKRKGIECGDCRAPFKRIPEEEKILLDQIGSLD